MKRSVFIFLILALLILALVSCTNNLLAGMEDKNAVNVLAKSDPQVALNLAQQAAESGDAQTAVENTTQSVVTTLASNTVLASATEDINPTEIASALNVVTTTSVSSESSATLTAAQVVLTQAASTINNAAETLKSKILSGEATLTQQDKDNLKDAAQTTVKAIATHHGFTMDSIASNANTLMPKDTTDSTMTANITNFLASLIATFPTNGEIEIMISMQKLARAANVSPEATSGTFDDPMMAVTLSMDEMVHVFYALVDTNGNGYLDSGDAIWKPYQTFLASSKSDDDLQNLKNSILTLPNPFKGDPEKFGAVKADLYDIIYNLKLGVSALSDLIPDFNSDQAISDLDQAKTQLDAFFSSGFDVTTYVTVGDLVNAIMDQF
jgi:hypothetical protein